jgi:putative Mg2+ transporter-C (MgtC) family protein
VRFLQTFELLPFFDSAISLGAAFILGTLIGAERQYRQRTAGLRTCVLVAVGAAAFVDLASRISDTSDTTRVISYVVSGVGFLGAGVIMKEGMSVRGLNTAATLWCSAAVGACAGADMVAEAALVTFFVIAGNTLLRPLANAINRIPFDERASEATYEVRLTTDTSSMPVLRDWLAEQLELARYPASNVEALERADETVELVARLIHTSVNPKELDAVIQRLERRSGVVHATWEVSTRD